MFTLFWLIIDSRGVLPVYEPAHWPTHATETSGSVHTHTRHPMTKKITRLILSDPGSLWWSYCMLVKGQLCASSDAYLWHNESSASVNCALGNIYREINFLLLLPLANDIKLFWHIIDNVRKMDLYPALLVWTDAPCESSASLKGGGEATFLHRAYRNQLTLPLQQHTEQILIPALKYTNT